ncbi:MAG: gamma-glutamyltransferase [Phycisphaerales bacterium]
MRLHGLKRLVVVAAVWLAPAGALAQTVYRQGVVAADHPEASRAGALMLEKGGNAVDAAVATSFALSVVRPQSCGIGGGGFMLVRLVEDPRTPGSGPIEIAIDYREQSPGAVGPDYFENLDDPDASRWSGSAAGVPGTVAGLLHALERFGTLDRATVMAPAIALAENGFDVDAAYVEAAQDAIAWFQEDPRRPLLRAFVWETLLRDGAVAVGDRIRNPQQAATLRAIARDGRDAFYTGEIAQRIVDEVARYGGAMTLEDLGAFEVAEREPLVGSFHGRRVLAMPPPSSGGVATLQVLGALERYEASSGESLASMGHNSAPYMHTVAEAMKHAFADRAAWMGDTDFADAPIDRLLSGARLDAIASAINPDETHRASFYGMAPAPAPDGGTSHLSVVDRFGNAVACTETINLGFGARIAPDGLGFCLNNEMDDFTTRRGQTNAFGLRQSDLNLPAARKRPLSSMSPTIVLGDDGAVELVVGASGGPRIITGTIETLLNVLVFGMGAEEAVGAPRFHHQWRPHVLAVEPSLDPASPKEVGNSQREVQSMMQRAPALMALRRAIQDRGHMWGTVPTVGVVQAIVRAPGAEGYEAASDPRKGGRPAGVTD